MIRSSGTAVIRKRVVSEMGGFRNPHFLTNGVPAVVIFLVGSENILLLDSGCFDQLEQPVDFTELGHADVHVVVQNGLEAQLRFGIFTHVRQDGSDLDHRRDLVRATSLHACHQ